MKASTSMAAVAATAVLGTAGAAYAVPSVANAVMTQRANSRIVDITYELTDEAAIVTLGIETNGVAIPDSAVTRLSGDVCKVVDTGAGKAIVWNAGADWPENLTQTAKAKVTAWATNTPPLYMVVDVSGGASASSYPVTYHVSAEALPYGGLTNEVYKNGYLVMRRITAGAFNMGEGTSVTVTLTNDFYAGVFEVTQGQWFNVMGSTPTASFTNVTSKAVRPMEKVTYDYIRGSSTAGGGGWPTNGNVYVDSFVGRLRTRTGNIDGFDLPTEAQWEYACRAGTTTYYNDNLAQPANTTSNAQMDVLGRYLYNGGDPALSAAYCGPENGTAKAGSYQPNEWGLYDMHGNVWEWCLDWTGTLAAGVNPKGASSGTGRVIRGGRWRSAASECRSASRSAITPGSAASDYGFRVVRTLP